MPENGAGADMTDNAPALSDTRGEMPDIAPKGYAEENCGGVSDECAVGA